MFEDLWATRLRTGCVLVGDQTHADELRQQVVDSTSEEQSPRDRFDTALAKIDEHLGDSAVTATDGPRDER